MAYKPGDIINGHVLNASGTRWEPLRYASNWDRWAGFGIALADYSHRREAVDNAAALLWTDCFGVFGEIGMNCSAALSLWRKCTLSAQFLTLPGNTMIRGSARRRVAWSTFTGSLMVWIRTVPAVAPELDAALPIKFIQVLSAQTEMMTELTVDDVAKGSRRARFTWEQSAAALDITARAAVGVPIRETWIKADDPHRIGGMLDYHVRHTYMSMLDKPRTEPSGRSVRAVKDIGGDPINLVTEANLPLYPDYLFAVDRAG